MRRYVGTSAEDIKKHKWFSDIDFNELERTKIAAPLVPNIKDPTDVSNFDKYDDIPVETSGRATPRKFGPGTRSRVFPRPCCARASGRRPAVVENPCFLRL